MTDPVMYRARLHATYREAMRQAREFEQKAEQWRLEAEQAYADAGSMKAEGRARAATRNPRMLPSHERGVDVHTNGYKAMQDAKGDFVLYMTTMANTYATMATMKYAKAQAVLAEYMSLPSKPEPVDPYPITA